MKRTKSSSTKSSDVTLDRSNVEKFGEKMM